MSTDLFEDTLRDLLRDTADAAGPGYLEPDADQVIGLGRRVVRRAAAVFRISARTTSSRICALCARRSAN